MKIPYGRQNISDKDIEAVSDVLKSDFLTQGPSVELFEKAFAEYIGCDYSIALSNGTAALHLCAIVLGVKKGINVITSPITFAASANCISYCDGNVWFADIDKETYTLDIDKVEELILSKPKGFFSGIIPVDFAGYAVDLEAFKALAEKYSLWIIEDSCHSPGGFFYDSRGIKQYCGNGKFADLSIFSFHPVKHIACGEGGMITTNNKEFYNKLKLLRSHGITKDPKLINTNIGGWFYEMQVLGYNYRLSDIQAALGNSQLKRAEEGIVRRRKIAAIYNKAFKNKKYILSHSSFIDGHAYHLYIIQVEERKKLYDFLKINNIFCQVHYIPVNKLPYYSKMSHQKLNTNNAEQYYSQCLSIPMYPSIKDEEITFVINKIYEYYKK